MLDRHKEMPDQVKYSVPPPVTLHPAKRVCKYGGMAARKIELDAGGGLIGTSRSMWSVRDKRC